MEYQIQELSKIKQILPPTAGKRITLICGKMKFCFHEESSILAEKTQSAGIANSLTGDTLAESFAKKSGKK